MIVAPAPSRGYLVAVASCTRRDELVVVVLPEHSGSRAALGGAGQGDVSAGHFHDERGEGGDARRRHESGVLARGQQRRQVPHAIRWGKKSKSKMAREMSSEFITWRHGAERRSLTNAWGMG